MTYFFFNLNSKVALLLPVIALKPEKKFKKYFPALPTITLFPLTENPVKSLPVMFPILTTVSLFEFVLAGV